MKSTGVQLALSVPFLRFLFARHFNEQEAVRLKNETQSQRGKELTLNRQWSGGPYLSSQCLLERGTYFYLGLYIGFCNWVKKPEICNYLKRHRVIYQCDICFLGNPGKSKLISPFFLFLILYFLTFFSSCLSFPSSFHLKYIEIFQIYPKNLKIFY